MRAYYNEIDPHAAQWLRNLIAENLIASGDVDERDIRDIKPSELAGYSQCHFFAGIGGWSQALRLAGWPDDRPVWTGSCPCQPFSTAGKGDGLDDERHLWPAWFHLIRECRPRIIFGEQVEAAIKHGWLDLVQSDLEAEGYAFAPVGLPAACVGAPHIRQRLWFVADANRERHAEHALLRQEQNNHSQTAGRGEACELANAELHDGPSRPGEAHGNRTIESHRCGDAGFWSYADWIPCTDGKARPVEPGTFPLAHGVSGRVGRLRAYGNAIEPHTAAELIAAYRSIGRPA